MSDPRTLSRDVALLTVGLGGARYDSVPCYVRALIGPGGLIPRDLETYLILDHQFAGTGFGNISAAQLARLMRGRSGKGAARSTANESLARLGHTGVIDRHREFTTNARGLVRDRPALTVLRGAARRVGRKVEQAKAARAEAAAQHRREQTRSLPMCPNDRTPTQSEEELKTVPQSVEDAKAEAKARCREATARFLGATGRPDTPRPPFPLSSRPESTP